ncbi:ATP-dependent DNA helicase RecG [Erysipelotrichaceae bacterium Oil+RF-744-GAM-WT-6]|jgi:ATP-dependent DNA helicase RecG|uniref:ATP-dependent DNA helicase RecG n=1 Tax=Stecheria intestinalis TaxID=2606630 RepID=A0A7X2TGX4_9FIRM|nr:ATP-dependent DNA helicase RecG [Stecheria intestinalis]MSS59675.1 ATP-dependent DNA helicase RecG [Stecheria intestinalis]
MELNDQRLRLTPKRISALESLGIADRDALLSYYPFRYEELNMRPVSEWHEKDHVAFSGFVSGAARSWRFGRNKTVTKFSVRTEEGDVLQVTIYNRPWASSLYENQPITVSGIYQGRSSVVAMTYNNKPADQQEAITPVYSTRTGIPQRTIRECVKHALASGPIEDDVPLQYQRAYRLLRRDLALRMVHEPKSMSEVQAAYRTLKYSEFLHFFTAVELMKNENGSDAYKQPKHVNHEKLKKVISGLPFPMTSDQEKALQEILADLESNHLMYRLVQGDVGCGKTLVAGLALYGTVTAGFQGALLAPTEILARQHASTLNELLSPYGVKVGVLYSGLKPAEKEQVLEDTADGSIDILIGTHSLLQEKVAFQKLGLVVADEQQRFGVEQRRALREKGTRVDFLLMSATPIPRTLASVLYGDMAVSTIETMPPGRKPVITKLIEENSFRSVLGDVKKLLAEGRQLYVICAAVDRNEDFNARAVSDIAESLSRLFAPDYRVGLLHGRMNSEEKQEIMRQFSENEIQVLVSTTVVEVGMNVVNATGMIIYDADRFGMSQLHQLRGRVQRGSSQGYCWLLTGSKDEKALERLNALVKSDNGFEIAQEDLRLRGPGDILGTRQSGVPDFILGNLVEDTKIMNQAKKDAAEIVMDPDNPDYVPLLESVRKRNEKNASFAD